jgi:hypothetical protein
MTDLLKELSVSLPRVTSLTLQDSELTTQQLRTLLTHFPNLRTLSMPDADCIHSLSFLEPVRRCLQSLSLSCSLSECAAADALRYLRSNSFPSLARLELCHTFSRRKRSAKSSEQRFDRYPTAFRPYSMLRANTDARCV